MSETRHGVGTCALTIIDPEWCCEDGCVHQALVAVLCIDDETGEAIEHARCPDHVLMPNIAATKRYRPHSLRSLR